MKTYADIEAQEEAEARTELKYMKNICCPHDCTNKKYNKYHATYICKNKKKYNYFYKIAIFIVNIAIVYQYGMDIYNISFKTGFDITNTALYMNDAMLLTAIEDMFKLTGMLFLICFWIAISEIITTF
jgi:hypothetical protein